MTAITNSNTSTSTIYHTPTENIAIPIERELEEREDDATEPLISTQRFFCQWETEKERKGLGVGVGYIGDTSSTIHDVYIEALHLSQTLNGILVFGVHRAQSQQVEAMIECWEEFLQLHHYGRFIQYFYGNGADVVEEALRRSYCSDQIVLVGINPSRIIHHPYVYYYRSWGIQRSWFLSRSLHVMTFSVNPNSSSIWSGGITDPVFIAAIQHAYYHTLGGYPDELLSHHIPISREVSQILQYPRTVREALIYKQVVDFTEGQWLMKISHEQLELGERWPEVRIAHLANITLCFARVGDYMYWLIKQAVGSYEELAPDPKKSWSNGPTPNPVSIGSVTNATQATTAYFSRETYSYLNNTGNTSLSLQALLNTTIEPVNVGIFSRTQTNTHFPREIYPCGIFPNGSFPDGFSMQLDQNTTFSYSLFFQGKLSGQLVAALRKPLSLGYTKQNRWRIYPYGFDAYGYFLPRNKHYYSRPYSVISRQIDPHYSDGSLFTPFNYTMFFSGAFNGLENSGITERIYPCGIEPDGKFTAKNLGFQQQNLYPYGSFPNCDFPYGSFFFDRFDYESAYLNHSQARGWYIHPNASRELTGTQLVQARNYLTWDWYTALGLAGLWGIQGSCSALLVATAHSRRWKRLRITAIAITSTMVVLSVVDCTYNIQGILHSSVSDSLVHGALIGYNATLLLQRFSLLVVKPLRSLAQSSLQRYPVEVVNGIRRHIVKIDNNFRESYRNILAKSYSLSNFVGIVCGILQLLVLLSARDPYVKLRTPLLCTDILFVIVKVMLVVALCIQFGQIQPEPSF